MLSALITAAILVAGQTAEPPADAPPPAPTGEEQPAETEAPADAPAPSVAAPKASTGMEDEGERPPMAPAPQTPAAVPAPEPAAQPAAEQVPVVEQGVSAEQVVGTEPDAQICEKGATNRCFCPDGSAGAQRCMADLSGWDTCVCAGWNTFRTAPKIKVDPGQMADNPPLTHTEILPETEVEVPPEATSDDENDVYYAVPLSIVLPGAGQLFKGDVHKGLRFFAAWAGPLVLGPPLIGLSALVAVNAWLNYANYATFANQGRTGALASEQSLRNQNAAVGAGVVAAGVVGTTVAAGAVALTISGVAWGWSIIDALAE